MLLVFFARMVDDLVASVVASAAERGKALIGRTEPEAPRARVELVPARPNASARWVDGSWHWNGRHWSRQAGHWAEGKGSRLSHKRAERAREAAARARRRNLMLLPAAASVVAR